MPESYFLLILMGTDGLCGLFVKSPGLECQAAWSISRLPQDSRTSSDSVKVSSIESDD